MVDYHRVLGVSRDASTDDIKAAFRRLALKFHPDRHANAPKSEQSRAAESFRQAKEAYEALADSRSSSRSNPSSSTYGSSAGSTWSNSSYSSAQSARGAYERSQRQWYQQQQQQQHQQRYSREWTYKSTGFREGDGGQRQYYERTVRWNWPPPSEGPRMVLRTTFFGMAVVTLMLVSSMFWRPEEKLGSYDQMKLRVQLEKQFREINREASRNREAETRSKEWAE